MKFSELFLLTLRHTEIPLRFEPGAEEAVLDKVTELLRAWIEAHEPADPSSDFDYGQKALIAQLLNELSGAVELPE